MEQNPYKAPSPVDWNERLSRKPIVVQLLSATSIIFAMFGAIGIVLLPLMLYFEWSEGDPDTFLQRCLLRVCGIVLWLAIAGIARFAKRRLDQRASS